MMNAVSFNELARNRRSTFPDQFVAGKKVEDNIINEIITNASWAPNHGKQEPWHFTVFSGDGLQKLASWQSELYKELAGENFKEITYSKLQQNPLKASHVIALCMKKTANKNIPEVEDVAAVACAVQNIYLSVTAYGLGGYWTTGGVTYKEKAKEFFGLDKEDKLMGFFYIGYIAIPTTGVTRKPLEEKLTWIN
ncbi:MAG: nitroreductase [Chitinophagaceae bacterium]|nr:nitroreductase [Chitinophagaceae bacterium]MBP6477969.1 nitroreductase [Chitinophagaceae bacterium]MBP7107163.1 nitroreductase [Chitinophagaceae bacterium]MBP7314850.1 nitroreductase [Chitinophagaceae bacterium]HQV54767.1 nitroreductase [Chitinophagaceae bacterium]